MRYEVKTYGKAWRVWDSVQKVYITKDCPSEEIAQEIADDFESMENGDYSPLFGN